MTRNVVYHIGINKKTLCGRFSENYIRGNKEYDIIKEIVDDSKKFIRLCKICDQIKKKEYNES